MMFEYDNDVAFCFICGNTAQKGSSYCHQHRIALQMMKQQEKKCCRIL
jgi:hypothetical protein